MILVGIAVLEYAFAETPKYMIIYDHKAASHIRLRWSRYVGYGGKWTLWTRHWQLLRTLNGKYKVYVPHVPKCLQSKVELDFIQGSRSSKKCGRVSFDINSAVREPQAHMYCANTYSRKWFKCRVAFTIRVALVDAHGKFMDLRNPGHFHICGVLSHSQKREMRKYLRIN